MQIGLAAGYTKNGEGLVELAAAGFDYIVVGTVTRDMRVGNPPPTYIQEGRRILNCMGVPSIGIHAVRDHLAEATDLQVSLILSLTGETPSQVVECAKLVGDLVDGIELNVSSPNYHTMLSTRQALTEAAERIGDATSVMPWVKLPPYFNTEQRDHVRRVVERCLSAGVTRFTLTNSHPVVDDRLSTGQGGESGHRLTLHTARIVREVRRWVGHSAIINACGGIMDKADVSMMRECGASTAQVYTAYAIGGAEAVVGLRGKVSS